MQPAVAYRVGLAEGWTLTGRGFADYANSDYMNEFFSIDQSQSSRSGLRTYDADAGWKDVGATLGVEWQFAQHWVTGVTGTYKRMIEDAGSSPVTRSAGNKNQGAGGLYVAYRF
jgi:outer membrane protein